MEGTMGVLHILGWIGSTVFVIFFIGMCIFVHELGHFMVAKWRGLHIDAFSLGFRKIWSKKVNGVEYRLGWLPFGGYVELPQVDTSEAVPKTADGRELPQAKPLDRILTAVAGPFCNIIFGLFLGCFIWIFGMPMLYNNAPMSHMLVTEVQENSPEFLAGLRPGDEIVSFNGNPFQLSWTDFAQQVMLSPGLEVELGVLRDGKPVSVEYVASIDKNPNKPEKLEFEGMPWPFFTVNLPLEVHPDEGSPLAKAGGEPGDLIVAENGHRHTDLDDFARYLQAHVGEPLVFTVRRADGEHELLPCTLRVETEYRIGVMFDRDGRIVGVAKDSPAEAAGVKPGERIVAIDGTPVSTVEEVVARVGASDGRTLRIAFEHDGATETREIAPKKREIPDLQASFRSTVYPSPFKQLGDTVKLSYNSLRGMLIYLGNKMHLTDTTSAVKPRNMSGIVGMATILFSASNTSFMTGLYFVVVVSFALAIFNLLPLPVLDGGHIFFALLEIIFRRPLPRSVIKSLSYLFVVLLVGFMIYVTYYDFYRLANDLNLLPEKAPAAAAAAVPAGTPDAPANGAAAADGGAAQATVEDSIE